MNDTIQFDWKIPPWSGQPVRLWIRVLGWVILLCVLIAGIAGLFLISKESALTAKQLAAVVVFALAELYFAILVFHVARKGIAPKSWWPWK